MVVTNMKELCLYAKQAKKLRAAEHRRKHAHDGVCSGLTDAEYNRVRILGKKSYTKARKFTHNRMWQQTSKKYSVEQLKLIAKQ
jgi:hypothetical protein